VSARLVLARNLALDAGKLIRNALGRAQNVERKSPVNLVTEIDRACERLIIDGIRAAGGSAAIVAEESAGGRPPDGPCWYVDPLDGTTNFVHGFPHCSVSIAYVDEGRVQTAVVHDPCKNETFEAERGSGAHLNGQPLHVSRTSQLSEALLVTGFPYDRRERSNFYLRYFEAFMHAAQDVRRLGSAALDLCYVAAGRFDGFWEWKLHPWDTAAGFLIVEEAGGTVTDFDGAAYDAWLPRILATNGLIHEPARDVLIDLLRSP
jgi:Archaeal fructose-1,6-bisphosphatase and related enzymes of inositol monophosphatase family